MCQIKIVNKYKYSNDKEKDYDIYIGRGSVFGNPYPIDDNNSREEVITKYEEYFNKQMQNPDSELYKGVHSLLGMWGMRNSDKRDIALVCFCAPKACHGDIIKKYLTENS